MTWEVVGVVDSKKGYQRIQKGVDQLEIWAEKW